ncbi:hypothetical protein [Pseudoalteromonas sp. BDTF-M6]|uniref:hypothetical protein n=1 Tax=Pseudoalteromonas sp. BDTF-M6 TaxID=2796132 RepID=UPI001BB00EAA|nr:hypothetical protein [Pseudoalteromonas sp. BDTF-M6]MBS3799288.1 hypothetical protein [Pseudoalteromonas sp. BDTF-M6]
MLARLTGYAGWQGLKNNLLFVNDMIGTEAKLILLIFLIVVTVILDYFLRKEWRILFSLLKKYDSKFENQYSQFGPTIIERAALIFQLSFCGLKFPEANENLLRSVFKVRTLNRLRYLAIFTFVVVGFIYT